MIITIIILFFILAGLGQSNFLTEDNTTVPFQVEENAWMDDDLYLE